MYVIFGFICVGLGARSVVIFCGGALCVAVPVTVLRVFLVNVTSFWSTFVLGGGNVTFHGIRVPRKCFIIDVSLVPLGHIRM